MQIVSMVTHDQKMFVTPFKYLNYFNLACKKPLYSGLIERIGAPTTGKCRNMTVCSSVPILAWEWKRDWDGTLPGSSWTPVPLLYNPDLCSLWRTHNLSKQTEPSRSEPAVGTLPQAMMRALPSAPESPCVHHTIITCDIYSWFNALRKS